MRLLFVCSGNTCRSPMAAALAQRVGVLNDLPVEVESAGLAACPGDPMAEHAMQALEMTGAFARQTLATHRSKALTGEMAVRADRIVCMNAGQAAFLRQTLLAANQTTDAQKVIAFAPAIADPFGGTIADYCCCAFAMSQWLTAFVGKAFGLQYLLRDGMPQDLAGLHLLEKVSFSTPFSKESLAYALESSGTRVLLVEKTDENFAQEMPYKPLQDMPLPDDEQSRKLVGSAILSGVLEIANLDSIAIDLPLRGRGLGKLLLYAILAEAGRAGYEQVELEVRASNTAAIGLYEKAGFVPVGRRKNYYNKPVEDAVLYTGPVIRKGNL